MTEAEWAEFLAPPPFEDDPDYQKVAKKTRDMLAATTPLIAVIQRRVKLDWDKECADFERQILKR